MIDHPTAQEKAVPDEADPTTDGPPTIRFGASDVITLDPAPAERIGFLADVRERRRNELIDLLFAPVADLPAHLGGPRTPLFAEDRTREADRFEVPVHPTILLASTTPAAASVAFVPAEAGNRRALMLRMLGSVAVIAVLLAVGFGLFRLLGSETSTVTSAPTTETPPSTAAMPTTGSTTLLSTTLLSTTVTTLPSTTVTTLASSTASTTAATASVATVPQRPAVSPTTARRATTTAPRRTTTTIARTSTTAGELVVPPSVSLETPTIFQPSTVPTTNAAPSTSTAASPATTTASPVTSPAAAVDE